MITWKRCLQRPRQPGMACTTLLIATLHVVHKRLRRVRPSATARSRWRPGGRWPPSVCQWDRITWANASALRASPRGARHVRLCAIALSASIAFRLASRRRLQDLGLAHLGDGGGLGWRAHAMTLPLDLIRARGSG